MKKLLSIALSLCLILSMLPMTVLAAMFSDMPSSDHWSYAALQSAVENGLLNGNKGKLNPSSPLTRAQMAAIINRAFGAIDTADISGFSDVSPADWCYTDIAKAVRMGTFTGNGDRMNPNAAITRQQAFTVLARAFRLEDGKAEDLAGFADAAKVSGYAVGPVAAMISAGYVNGKNGNICPTDTITREQFAQVIYNMLKTYISDAGTYTEDLSGNVMVNVPGVVLKDMTIDGDLIVGEGVGDGEVTLDGVNLTGRLVIRGGGENSIVIKNKSNVGSVVLSKTGDGGVRLHTEEGCRVDVVYIPDGKDDIILEGTFNQVDVATDAPVVLKSATVAGLTVSGENANIATQGHTEITTVVVEEKAVGATLTVDGSSKVATLTSAAEGVTIDGKGTVTQAFISGNNTAVNTKGTSITTDKNTTGVTAGGTTVAPGTVSKPTAPSTPSVPATPNTPSYSGTVEVSTLAELKSALQTAETIQIKSLILVDKDALTVNAAQTLEIDGGLILTGKKASLTNNGTLINRTQALIYEEVDSGAGDHVYENGEYVYVEQGGDYICRRNWVTVDGTDLFVEFFVSDNAVLTNNGTFHNRSELLIDDGTFRNSGTFTQTDPNNHATVVAGTFVNSGIVNNSGAIFTESEIRWHHRGAINDNSFYEKLDKDTTPSVTIGGMFTNSHHFGLDFSTAVVTGILNNNAFMSASDLTVEKDGIINNKRSLDILGGAFVNKGTVNNDQSFGINSTDKAASFENSGTFNNGTTSNTQAFAYLHDASFNNSGRFVNNGNVDLYHSTLVHGNGNQALFENSGYMHITGGGFDVSKASANTFVNTGYFEIRDCYGDGDGGKSLICQVNLGKHDAFRNDSNWVNHIAEATSEEGLPAAEAAQRQLIASANYFGFGPYDTLMIRGDITISKDTTFSAFPYYCVIGNHMWNPDTQEDIWVPGTLTVKEGVTLTLDRTSVVDRPDEVRFSLISVENGGVLNNEGVIQNTSGHDGWCAVVVHRNGSYIGDGQVNGRFEVRFMEKTDDAPLTKPYTAFTVVMDQNSSLSAVYSDSDNNNYYDFDGNAYYNFDGLNVQTVTYFHEGDLSGAALTAEKTSAIVEVFTFLGLKAANLAELGSKPLFEHVQIWDAIELEEDFALRNAWVAHESNLIIPYGKTLTVNGSLSNDGDIHVDGTVEIEEGAVLHNWQNLEVGALGGKEIARIIVKGYLRNEGNMTLYPTAELIKVQNQYGWYGEFANYGTLNDNSRRNDFAGNS